MARDVKSLFLAAILAAALPAAGSGGGGEGGGAKKEEAKALPEWVEIQSRLQTLRAKIAAKDRAVRDLIKEKEHAKDPRRSHEIVTNMTNEHRELREATEEYDRQLNLLRYRFPEKGLKEQQRYKRVDVKSLDELEKQVGMEARLKQVTGKVQRQYGDPAADGTAASVPAKPEKKEPADADSESIVLPPVMSK